MKIAPKAFFFDFDGVIVDSEHVHMVAAQAAVQAYGVSFTRDYYYQILLGFDDIGLFRHLWQENKGQTLDDATLKELMVKKNQAFMDNIRHSIVFFTGVVDLIKALHDKGVPLAVVSGALKKEIQVCLEAGGLAKYFQIVVSADEVKRSKPDPESYVAAFNFMKAQNPALQPHECWAIEDSPAGIQSAKGARLNVIGITNSVTRPQLGEADLIIERYAELEIS